MLTTVAETLQDFALHRAGKAFWDEVLGVSGLKDVIHQEILSVEEHLHRLIWASSYLLGISSPKLLRLLGYHQGRQLALREGFSASCPGEPLIAVLENLQEQIAQSVGPTGWLQVVHEEDQQFWLEYRSPRLALGPFIVGMLEGIAEPRQLRLEVEHCVLSERDGFDAFRIQILARHAKA